ncbi:MAG: RND transporter [Proteobacteria bacterium]|nr:MAG: RND transporter [Pseudomonadota bacterium]
MSLNTTLLTPVLAALVLAGCATLPQIDASALPAAPAAYREHDARWMRADTAAVPPRADWWALFDDPLLDQLEQQAAEHNNALQTAAANLARARAVARITDADRAPQIGVGAQLSREGGPLADAAGTAGTLGRASASFAYEVDLFGRLSEASRAARLDVDAQASLLDDARLLVQGAVAETYLAIRALDEERRVVRDTVGAYQNTLLLSRQRLEAGDISELDVARVETELAVNESDALALDRRRAVLEHSLAVLVGQAASDFTLAPGDWQATLPSIPAGLPSALLSQRPDVLAAQRAVLAAQARVGVAQAAWFPNIALTADAGYASTDLGDLFKWSTRAWGIGALMSLPIFDGGRRDAAVQGAQATLDAALSQYREQALIAFRDVEDQLASLRLLAEQSDAQSRAVSSASRAMTLSAHRYENGLVSQLDLLDARRSELASRRVALQVKAARYQSTVALVRALGGRWASAGSATDGAGATRLQ